MFSIYSIAGCLCIFPFAACLSVSKDASRGAGRIGTQHQPVSTKATIAMRNAIGIPHQIQIDKNRIQSRIIFFPDLTNAMFTVIIIANHSSLTEGTKTVHL
jgi:hypothetical protein